PAGPNTTMRESLDANTAAPEILGRGMQGRAVRGDLVIVFGELAEVLEVRAGPLGYESYKVKYLSKPLLEDIPEDWHIAQHVAGLLDLDGMKATIQRRATGGSIDENTAQFMLSLP